MVSKAEIDRLYAMDKIIEEDWSWTTHGPNHIGEATVYCIDSEAQLTLKAWKRRRYGFCLLFKSSKIVRRWDIGDHTNPDGEQITGPHKHYWHPKYEDGFAYEVDDVATDDVDEAFSDFLDECNIELRGTYTRQDTLGEA